MSTPFSTRPELAGWLPEELAALRAQIAAEAGLYAPPATAGQVDQAGHAMLARPLDDEIGRRLAGRADLGPNTGITRLQGAIAQFGPVAPHLGVKGIAPRRIDLQVMG